MRETKLSTEPKVIGIREMQIRYQCSRDTIARRVASGELPKPCTAFCRTRKWYIADLEEFDKVSRTY